MEILANMKSTTKPEITTSPSKDHTGAKYIFEYIKKGTPHVKIVLGEEATHLDNWKLFNIYYAYTQ